MANNQRFYDLLDIPKNASDAEIKKSYRAAALKNHPDKGGDPERFKEISMAYEALSDPEKRKIYDQLGEEGLKEGGQVPQNFHDPFNLFRNMFGGGFRFRSAPSQRRVQKCPDIHKTFTLTLEEVYRGMVAHISYQLQETCSTCQGKGVKAGIKTGQCQSCQGNGSKIFTRRIGPGLVQQIHTSCDQCRGTGRFVSKDDECQVCKGKQTIQTHKNMALKLPVGISSKDTILVKGQGNQHPDKIPGDIKVQIREHPHLVFKRSGNDLIVEKKISLLDAIAGFQFPLTFLDGKERVIQCHSIINPHQDSTKRLINQGIPHRNNPGIKGSMFFKFQVEYPTHILSTLNEEKTLASHLQMSRLMIPINKDEKRDSLKI